MLDLSQFKERRNAIEKVSGNTCVLTFDKVAPRVVERPIHEIIAITLYDIDKPIAVIVAGEKNAGKTSLVKHLFTEHVFRNRYDRFGEDEPQPSWDLSDVTTPTISRLPLGTTQDPKRIVLYDTPDLASEDPAKDNTARVALGMEQRAPKLRAVEFRAYNLPDTLNGAANFDEKQMPVDQVPQILKEDGELTCIYVVNAADRLKPEALAEKVTWLRKQFDGKVIFAKTFEDTLQAWQNTPMDAGGKGQKDRRYEDLDAILGKDAVSVNGLTGEGIEGLVHALLKRHGCQGAIGTVLSLERKRERLFSAARQIPQVLIPAFFSFALTRDAATQLPYLLAFLADAVIKFVSTEQPSQDPEMQAAFEEKMKRFTAALKASAVEEKWVMDFEEPKEFWGKLGQGLQYSGSVFTGHSVLRYINGTELSRTPEVLAELYYWVYTLLYEMDQIEEISVIETPKVPAAAGRNWFGDLFEAWRENFPSFSADHRESTPKLWEFYRPPGNGEYALCFFLSQHHPEAVPFLGF